MARGGGYSILVMERFQGDGTFPKPQLLLLNGSGYHECWTHGLISALICGLGGQTYAEQKKIIISFFFIESIEYDCISYVDYISKHDRLPSEAGAKASCLAQLA